MSGYQIVKLPIIHPSFKPCLNKFTYQLFFLFSKISHRKWDHICWVHSDNKGKFYVNAELSSQIELTHDAFYFMDEYRNETFDMMRQTQSYFIHLTLSSHFHTTPSGPPPHRPLSQSGSSVQNEPFSSCKVNSN